MVATLPRTSHLIPRSITLHFGLFPNDPIELLKKLQHNKEKNQKSLKEILYHIDHILRQSCLLNVHSVS